MNDFTSPQMGVLNEDGIRQGYEYFPHFRALHPDTKYQVYRELKHEKNVVELTIFYREPGEDKKRVDAEFDIEDQDDLGPHTIRIVYWGSAVRF